MARTFTYRSYGPDEEIRHKDLREEAIAYTDKGVITVYDETGTTPAPETAEYVYLPGRLGIAWGADSSWADVDGLESGIEMWLNDGDEWEARN